MKKGRRLGLGLGMAWSCPDTFNWASHLSESVSSPLENEDGSNVSLRGFARKKRDDQEEER